MPRRPTLPISLPGVVATGLLAAALLAAAPSAPAAAAQNCIQTYDRKGNVTGRYCSDGPADTSEPVEQVVPSGSGAGGAGGRRATVQRVNPGLPDGVDIKCGGKGQRCRGTFFLR
ncbi:hypothetical protein [uncultured Alsobacter sp.]|uniref:hypothetical protein n=1 Tax=uncultured Alsobacter sp. TaxID=1748258 RepID=UPI0025E83502|nr:hypothetical protein [uncultured Alsobacter sp.]